MSLPRALVPRRNARHLCRDEFLFSASKCSRHKRFMLCCITGLKVGATYPDRVSSLRRSDLLVERKNRFPTVSTARWLESGMFTTRKAIDELVGFLFGENTDHVYELQIFITQQTHLKSSDARQRCTLSKQGSTFLPMRSSQISILLLMTHLQQTPC
jgi:hypothetical protein